MCVCAKSIWAAFKIPRFQSWFSAGSLVLGLFESPILIINQLIPELIINERLGIHPTHQQAGHHETNETIEPPSCTLDNQHFVVRKPKDGSRADTASNKQRVWRRCSN